MATNTNQARMNRMATSCCIHYAISPANKPEAAVLIRAGPVSHCMPLPPEPGSVMVSLIPISILLKNILSYQHIDENS
jgi:hypothetical protein